MALYLVVYSASVVIYAYLVSVSHANDEKMKAVWDISKVADSHSMMPWMAICRVLH